MKVNPRLLVIKQQIRARKGPSVLFPYARKNRKQAFMIVGSEAELLVCPVIKLNITYQAYQ